MIMRPRTAVLQTNGLMELPARVLLLRLSTATALSSAATTMMV
jgi:hypothetical protein